MRVCADCLRTINDHEGCQIVKKIYVDERDPRESRCDFCEETGFDVLYEIYEEKRFNDAITPITKEELWEMIDALNSDFGDDVMDVEIGDGKDRLFVKMQRMPGSGITIFGQKTDPVYGWIYLYGEEWAKVREFTMNDVAKRLAKILRRDSQFKEINEHGKYDPWSKK